MCGPLKYRGDTALAWNPDRDGAVAAERAFGRRTPAASLPPTHAPDTGAGGGTRCLPQRRCSGPPLWVGKHQPPLPIPCRNPPAPFASRSRGGTARLRPVPEHRLRSVTSVGTFEWDPSPNRAGRMRARGPDLPAQGAGRDLATPRDACNHPALSHGTHPLCKPSGEPWCHGEPEAAAAVPMVSDAAKLPRPILEGCLGRRRPAPCFAPGSGRHAQGRQRPPVTPACTAGDTEGAGYLIPAATGEGSASPAKATRHAWPPASPQDPK